MTEEIPFLDLASPHIELEEELIEVVRAALRSGRFIGGPEVETFEQNFARFCDAPHCVAVNSGTDALRFALMALGVGRGDIVITVPNTFIATTEAISQTGATPAFVDVDERTYNMDPELLRAYLETICKFDIATGRTYHRKSRARIAAVVPVHIYGQMADMDRIMQLAREYHLAVVEDACQAHGAEYYSKRNGRWQKAGSVGHAAAFSFYPGKNLGACGEGGAVTTHDPLVDRKIRMLRDHGQRQKYHHEMEGYNGRLDSIQCGMLRIKLTYLKRWNEQRQHAATRYFDLLKDVCDIILPYEPEESRAVYHLFVVRSLYRDELQTHLNSKGIGTGLHYPVPLHLQKPYAEAGFKRNEFPISEMLSTQILSLPMYPQLTGLSQQKVVSEISRFYAQRQKTETPVLTS